MSKIALVIVGNLKPLNGEFLNELKGVLNKQGNYPVTFVVDYELSINEFDFIQNALQCEVESVNVNSISVFDAVYKVKSQVDQKNIISCCFVTSQHNSSVLETVTSSLFSPVYNVVIHTLQSLEASKHYDILDEKAVKSYLSSIPSTDGNEVTFLQSKLIPSMFLHGYSGRQGGISTHPGLLSLNLCYSVRKTDPLSVVEENRARLATAANFEQKNLFIAKAVHGKDVWVFEENEPKSYDAIVTNTSNTYVAAPGADCNMLLFADPITKSCGAAHAGWKGILCGVVQATVNTMIKKYATNPKDLVVSIGPSLSSCCCEFGVDESKKFLSIGEKCVIWKENCSKPFLDLRLAAKILLIQCGVLPYNIDDGKMQGSALEICTKCDPNERFYSFRRIGPQFGNQVGFIGFP